MTNFSIAEQFRDHPAIQQVSGDARQLYLDAAWCAKVQTGSFDAVIRPSVLRWDAVRFWLMMHHCPWEMHCRITEVDHPVRRAKELVTAGLWLEVDGGWLMQPMGLVR